MSNSASSSDSGSGNPGQSLQEVYAPNSICFGCGPANEKGLRIRSFAAGDETVCSWSPEDHHEAFPGMLSGGIVGTLLDCHSNWTSAWHLMKEAGLIEPPCTVTAEFHVKLLRPTPSGVPVQIRARVASSQVDRVRIEAELTVGEKVTATCVGLFVAVREGHPAYHRWS